MELRKEDVQHLSMENERFDTVFTSCVFCSVTTGQGIEGNPQSAKKGGQLLMIEHVRSKNPVLGRLMDVLNPIIVRLGGENINRDTVRNVEKADFKIVEEKNLASDVLKAIIAIKQRVNFYGLRNI